MDHHERQYREYLAELTPEQIADDEARLLRDTSRMERTALIRYMRTLIKSVEHVDPSLASHQSEALDHIVAVLALWKRNEVTSRVALRKVARLHE